QPHGFRPFFAPWVIRKPLPIYSVASARTPRRETCGTRCRATSIVFICRKRGPCTLGRTCPRELPPLLRSPISVSTGVDCRLAGLAQSAGAVYTRYADNLAFSGSEAFERCSERFSTHVAAIMLEEGLAVNHRKTRLMRQGVRQHLAGVVVNRCMNA